MRNIVKRCMRRFFFRRPFLSANMLYCLRCCPGTDAGKGRTDNFICNLRACTSYLHRHVQDAHTLALRDAMPVKPDSTRLHRIFMRAGNKYDDKREPHLI